MMILVSKMVETCDQTEVEVFLMLQINISGNQTKNIDNWLTRANYHAEDRVEEFHHR